MSRSLAEQLIAQGMSPGEAARKASLFATAAAVLPTSRPPDFQTWFVPGRVELLGKHTDYAGGRSLLCAVERGFCVVARVREAAELSIVDAASGSRAMFPLRADAADAPHDWTVYPRTVARRLVRDFGITRGVELAFASDLPAAAGLSSSSALCIGVFLALSHANALGPCGPFRAAVPDLFQLAGYLGAVENGKPFGSFPGERGVGTLGGSQDQTAILCASPGELVQFSFDPVRFERRIPFPAELSLVIGASGVSAEKTGAANAAYNEAAGAVAEILRRWQRATGRSDRTLAAALTGAPDAGERLRSLVAGEAALRARLEQFVSESEELVPQAGDALARGALAEFGAVVERSHAGAERGLRNQVAETIHLQRRARALGAIAASAFGAGFGGSVWAMVEAERAGEFRSQWQADYAAAFPQHMGRALFFTTRAGPSALALDGSAFD